MPFTPSHAAAALLFSRTPLPFAALVAGTVAPDLPYYFPGDTFRHLTHDPLGIVSVDLLIGWVALIAWFGFLREPVFALLPRSIQVRMPRASLTRTLSTWPLATAAIVLGAVSHLAWDAFTHPGPVVDALPLLNEQWGPLLVHKWLQHSSSVVGAVILAIAAVMWIRRSPTAFEARAGTTRFRSAGCFAIALTFAVSGVVAWTVGMLSGLAPLDPGLVFRVARVSMGAALASTVAVCLAWHLRRRYSRPTTPVS